MHAVARVAMHIRQVHEQPAVEKLQSLIRIPELRSHDGLHHRRKSGIPRGQPVVVVIVRPLDLLGESLPLQEQSQHHVRLLQDLIAVDRQRVIVQQQGPLRLTVRIVQIPDLAVEEEIILRIDPQLLIEGDVHLLGCQLPAIQLGIVELVLGSQVRVVIRPLGAHRLQHLRSHAQVILRHHVGVEVVIHHRGVLIRAGDRVDLKAILRGVKEADGYPEPGRTQQDLHTLPHEEFLIPGGVEVLHQREGHVRVDVILRRARGVVRGGLVPVNRAPREEHAVVGKLQGTLVRGGQHLVAETQGIAGVIRVRVAEERHHVDLRVPEIVPAVSGTGQPLGGNTGSLGPRGGLDQLEDAPAGRLLQLWLATDAHVRALPECAQPLALIFHQAAVAHLLRPVDRTVAAEGQLLRCHVAGGVVANELLQAQVTALRSVDVVDDAGDVLRDLRCDLDIAGVRGRRIVHAQLVVHGGGDRHAGVVDLVTQGRALRFGLGLVLRDQDALVEGGALPRVQLPVLDGDGAVVIRELALAVLAVEQLGGDDDGGVRIQQLHFERHDREVTFLEADHALGGHAHTLAAGGAPDHAAPQHAVAEVEGAAVLTDIRVAEAQRLVVDVQAHRLRVRDVDDGLPIAGQAVGVLGVGDLPVLVDAIDIGAVDSGVAAFGRVAAHAEVAVRLREQRLRDTQVGAVGLGFRPAPLPDGVVIAVDQLQWVDAVVVAVRPVALGGQVRTVDRPVRPLHATVALGCEEGLKLCVSGLRS